VNICTCLSRVKQHKQAIQFAKQAIKKLNVTVVEDKVMISEEEATENIAATAVIAYFNAAVEAEYLSMWLEAKTWYEFALKLIKIGPE